jgi:hypothetical protein
MVVVVVDKEERDTIVIGHVHTRWHKKRTWVERQETNHKKKNTFTHEKG